MKLICLILLLSFSAVSCNKNRNKDCFADMVFTKVSVSAASSTVNGILFDTEAYGGNLCYSFSHFKIEKTGDKTYTIRVIAAIPCGRPICAQALYQANPSGKIENVSPGVYSLHFYNMDALFTSVSVTIN